MVYPRCRLKKEKGGVPVISWMYRMVWESIWIFSFMVPVLWMWQTVFAGKYTPKTHRIGLWLFAFYVAGLVAVTGVFRLLFTKPVFGTSFAIEVLQMFCGRTSDVDDLLMNTLGALIGYWMFLAAERQTSFCLLRRNKTAEAGVAVSRAFHILAYEN